MCFRSTLSATALALALAMTSSIAKAHDEAKYPNWKGQWRVVLTRALASPDTASQLPFRTGRAIPVAFFASDGSNGEHGTRMAVSTWYFLALDEPVPARVFISPVLAMVLTLGLGMLVVWRAQQKTSHRRQQ